MLAFSSNTVQSHRAASVAQTLSLVHLLHFCFYIPLFIAVILLILYFVSWMFSSNFLWIWFMCFLITLVNVLLLSGHSCKNMKVFNQHFDTLKSGDKRRFTTKILMGCNTENLGPDWLPQPCCSAAPSQQWGEQMCVQLCNQDSYVTAHRTVSGKWLLHLWYRFHEYINKQIQFSKQLLCQDR